MTQLLRVVFLTRCVTGDECQFWAKMAQFLAMIHRYCSHGRAGLNWLNLTQPYRSVVRGRLSRAQYGISR